MAQNKLKLADFNQTTGTTDVAVFQTSPTLITPVLGAATATTINTVTIPSVVGSVPVIIKSDGIAGTPTSSLTEVNLKAIKIPAGTMGANGHIVVDVLYKMVGTVGAKTINIRHSTSSGDVSTGTLWVNLAVSSTALSYYLPDRMIYNSNSASAQIFYPAASGGTGNSTATPGTGAINTANDSYININGLVANIADSINVVSYTVTFYPGV